MRRILVLTVAICIVWFLVFLTIAFHAEQATTMPLVPAHVQQVVNSTWMLHRMAPNGDLTMWSSCMASWTKLLDRGDRALGWHRSWEQRIWHDDDLAPLLHSILPQHADRIMAMRAPVERNDMARYAILYRYGGVYADLDMKLLRSSLFSHAASGQHITLPFEKGRLVGQSIMLAPAPQHAFWMKLIDWLVEHYDPACYEPLNTGPDAVTIFWNTVCTEWSTSVIVADGFMTGKTTYHMATGSWTRVGDSVQHRIRSVTACPHKTFAHYDLAKCGTPRSLVAGDHEHGAVTQSRSRNKTTQTGTHVM